VYFFLRLSPPAEYSPRRRYHVLLRETVVQSFRSVWQTGSRPLTNGEISSLPLDFASPALETSLQDPDFPRPRLSPPIGAVHLKTCGPDRALRRDLSGPSEVGEIPWIVDSTDRGIRAF